MSQSLSRVRSAVCLKEIWSLRTARAIFRDDFVANSPGPLITHRLGCARALSLSNAAVVAAALPSIPVSDCPSTNMLSWTNRL